MKATDINQLRIEKMIERLKKALSPSSLSIIDESHLHVGHAGAKTGKGHFALTIISTHFDGLPPLKRHQLVYQALGDLLDTDIHAVRINTSC